MSVEEDILFKFRMLTITYSQVCRKQGPVLCRPSKNVRHVFKRSWDIILGPAQDRPLQSVSNLRNSSSGARYFDLLGRRVSAPVHGQLYIVKQGRQVSKRVF